MGGWASSIWLRHHATGGRGELFSRLARGEEDRRRRWLRAGGSGGGRAAGTVGGRREGAVGRRGACARSWLISRAAAGSGLRAADLVSEAATANDGARAWRSSRSSLPVSARDVARACEGGGPRAAARCEEAGSGGREKRITPFDRRLLLRFIVTVARTVGEEGAR